MNWDEDTARAGGISPYEMGMLVKAIYNSYPATKNQREAMERLEARGLVEPNLPRYPSRWRLTKKGGIAWDAIPADLRAQETACWMPRS
jgi:hypothetical protein